MRSDRAHRVLVTGGSGFVGGHLIASLAPDCTVLATHFSRRIDPALQSANVSPVCVDLSDRASVEQLEAFDPDVIVHTAALSSPWGPRTAFEKANVVATGNVLEVAERCGAPVVALSTPTIYMNGEHRYLIDESAPLPATLVNDYAATKLIAEELVQTFAQRTRLPAAILRPQAIVGEGDPSVAPRFLRVAERGFFPVIDGGTALFDMTHVANVVHAIESCIDRLVSGSWSGAEVFNITNGNPRPVRDLVESFLSIRNDLAAGDGLKRVRIVSIPRSAALAVASAVERVSKQTGGSEPVVTRYSIRAMAEGRTLDIERARRMLDYDPAQFTIDDAFRSFLIRAQS